LIYPQILVKTQKYFRRQNDETREMRGVLAEYKKRLSKLENDVNEGDENTIFRWLDRMRTHGATLKALR